MENSRALYEKCWDILVEHAGVYNRPYDKESFVLSCLNNGKYDKLTEYRFCGSLGFGGKFWRYDGKLYISCYPEDNTPQRQQVINKVNSLLQELIPEGGVWGPPSNNGLE